MSETEGSPTEGTAPDSSRSGADVADAIRVAEAGRSVQEVHDRPGETSPREAPVERHEGDPEMTEGQVVLGEGTAGGDTGSGPAAPEGVSGGAQSVQGGRASDRVAADPDA
ncbi:hypothetical protein ACI782_14160 [Geodermatophilus sp. SYSU D00703]